MNIEASDEFNTVDELSTILSKGLQTRAEIYSPKTYKTKDITRARKKITCPPLFSLKSIHFQAVSRLNELVTWSNMVMVSGLVSLPPEGTAFLSSDRSEIM